MWSTAGVARALVVVAAATVGSAGGLPGSSLGCSSAESGPAKVVDVSSELAGGARVDAVRADGGGAGRSRRGTPSQIEALLRRAAAALAAQSRVRLQGSLTEIEGKVGVYVAVDVRAGAAYGTLSETIATGGKRLRLGALLTPGRGYCTGDPDALTAACSLSARQAWAAVGRWVYFGPGSEAYQTVAASVLYRNEMGGLLPSLPASRFVLTKLRSLAGQRVEELRGPAPAAAHFPVGTTETIDLSRAGLPVRVRFEDPGRVAAVEWFDAWGERFAVHAPVRPVAVSKLA